MRTSIALLTRLGLIIGIVFGLLALSVSLVAAQSTTVQITGASPIQVIADVPLVAGKATVLKLTLTASAKVSGRVNVTFGGRNKSESATLARGTSTLYVKVDPPAAPGTITFSAQFVPSGGTASKVFQGQAQVLQLQRDRMKVFFLPVDWTAADRAKSMPGKFNSFVTSSGDFFRGTYPFPENNITIGSTQTPYMLSPDERAIVDASGNFNWGNITALYSSLVLAGRRQQPDADLVVGVLPPKWYARVLNDPAVVGLELNVVKAAVSSQVDSDYATLAHEAGHIFGRFDDYDFGRKPPLIGTRIDAPGYWVAKGRPITPADKQAFYSFMGASDARSQYWVDRDTYLSILEMLQSGAAP
ncbi:MAG TPA: hypothetical protein VM536_00560 [Chloroflexia bacterium]|nr:hypothetical protein [Chloroflexia bacterium]